MISWSANTFLLNTLFRLVSTVNSDFSLFVQIRTEVKFLKNESIALILFFSFLYLISRQICVVSALFPIRSEILTLAPPITHVCFAFSISLILSESVKRIALVESMRASVARLCLKSSASLLFLVVDLANDHVQFSNF